ncbi:unnamed protein product [Symbiodinium sp. CCMP2456]|nr:unnamed protein product [Symbiodinium sp. CCMP2456]
MYLWVVSLQTVRRNLFPPLVQRVMKILLVDADRSLSCWMLPRPWVKYLNVMLDVHMVLLHYLYVLLLHILLVLDLYMILLHNLYVILLHVLLDPEGEMIWKGR